MAQRYVVTGGAGFIGTNLVERLVADGNEVVVVDDLAAGDHRARLPAAVVFYELDICDTAALTDAVAGADVIVHLAALPRVQFSIESPQETHRVNVDGTLSVLEAARRNGVRRVVYAASSSAYGDQEQMPLSETLPPHPKSPYALQKYIGEGLLRLWSELYGLETVSLRFFNVYGPHMDPDGAYALVVGKFLKLRMTGKPLTITGDGEQTRDFTHVRDVVDALMRAATRTTVGQGEVINIGAGHNVSVKALAALIGGPTTHIEARVEPRHTLADTSRAKALLEWEPRITLADGIAELMHDNALRVGD